MLYFPPCFECCNFTGRSSRKYCCKIYPKGIPCNILMDKIQHVVKPDPKDKSGRTMTMSPEIPGKKGCEYLNKDLDF